MATPGRAHAVNPESVTSGARAYFEGACAARSPRSYGNYPDAKVLHTVRDPEEWFQSVHATIFAPDGPTRREGEDVPARFFASIRRRLPSQLDDRAVMTLNAAR